jgi:hypothetical protein
MKFEFPSQFAAGEAPIRPGFDVLMAVTGARQATSPTAQLVAARRALSGGVGDVSRRCELLATGRLLTASDAASVARFANVDVVQTIAQVHDDAKKKEMNDTFTTAFQPMVKLADVTLANTADHHNGDGAGTD